MPRYDLHGPRCFCSYCVPIADRCSCGHTGAWHKTPGSECVGIRSKPERRCPCRMFKETT